jgi:hypothetical protein
MTNGTGRQSWAWIGAMLGLLVLGCSAGRDERVPVEGRITVQGQPLLSGTVVFHPNAARGNTCTREPRAAIRSDAPGRYQLTTDDKPGAAPGWYRVTVFALKPITRENAQRPPEWLADEKYADVQRSGLEVEVVSAPAPGAYDFDLKAPQKH